MVGFLPLGKPHQKVAGGRASLVELGGLNEVDHGAGGDRQRPLIRFLGRAGDLALIAGSRLANAHTVSGGAFVALGGTGPMKTAIVCERDSNAAPMPLMPSPFRRSGDC